MSAPIDDKENIEWLESVKKELDDNYEICDLLPEVILQINEKIDRIVELCINKKE